MSSLRHDGAHDAKMMRKLRFNILTCFVATGCALAGGCGTKPSTDHKTEAKPGVERTTHDDVMSLNISISPAKLSLHDTARVALEVTSESGVTVHVADYADALRDGDRRFELSATLTDKHEAEPTDDGRLRWHYDYDVTFFLPGDYEFPPASASYVDMRDAAGSDKAAGATADTEPQTHTLESEAMTVTVTDDRAQPLTPQELADIKVPDPVGLHRPLTFTLWIAAIVALAVCGLVAYLVRRRSRAERIAPPMPAHVWARLQLDALQEEDLIGHGLAQEFFYRISGIVRGYIERRFAVSAPEMTTEEFLTAAGTDRRFDREQTGSLNGFLTACDLVKYARHDPSSTEATGAVRAAEDFVERTREREEAAPPEEPTRTGGAT